MGAIIDLEEIDDVLRCNIVKIYIVYINLIGAPVSFLFLLFGVLRMLISNKNISFLTSLIIIIFLSEIINTISKMIQLLKYIFPDLRLVEDEHSKDTPRGIICQIQIVTAIFSDYCTLLTTLLLSLRCYDVIRNKIRFFDKKNIRQYSIIFVILISIILSFAFLFIDRAHCDNVGYRFDKRDRCSYWCWLEHLTSLICFCFYVVILFCNIFFAFKTYRYLKKGYKRLLEENDICIDTGNNAEKPLNDNQQKYSHLTKEEKKRIEELRIMRIKCLIYPFVTIGIWAFAITYRVFELVFFWDFDMVDNPVVTNDEEKEYFENHRVAQIFVQCFLVIHTFISSTKGIFYGFSFIVFEEKKFCNFFRICCFSKKDELNDDLESKGILKDSFRKTENEEKNPEDDEEEGDQKDNENNGNDNIEMNSQAE